MAIRFFAFLLVLTVGLAGPVQAQLAGAEVPNQYCALIASGNHYSAMLLRLEFGQEGGDALTPAQQAEAAKVKDLTSLVGALNYLSRLGWELVASNTMPVSFGDDKVYYSEQQYILRRRR